MRVDVLCAGHALLEHTVGLHEEGVLQAVQHEPGLVLDERGLLASRPHEFRREVDGGSIGALMGDDLDAGDERRRVAVVHAEEPLRMLHRLGQRPDRDGGGVAADHGPLRSRRAHPAQGGVLDLEHLRHRLLDEDRVGDRILDLGSSERRVDHRPRRRPGTGPLQRSRLPRRPADRDWRARPRARRPRWRPRGPPAPGAGRCRRPCSRIRPLRRDSCVSSLRGCTRSVCCCTLARARASSCTRGNT